MQPPEGAEPPLAAAVRAAKPNREIAVSGEEIAETAFVAYFDRIFGRTDPVFLEYKLPAIAMPAPIQVDMRHHGLNLVLNLCTKGMEVGYY